jgi:protein TonB
MPLAVGVIAVGLAAGIWYGMRTPQVPEKSSPLATAPLSQPANIQSISTPPAGKTITDAVPATAVVLRGNALSPEVRPEIRPGNPSPATALAKAVMAPPVPNPSPAPAAAGTTVPSATSDKPVANAVVAASASPVPAPIAPPAAAPAATAMTTASTAPANPPPSTTAAVETAAPLQVAAMAPSMVASRPAAASPLRAISRDPPEFPREAEGLKSGIVSARIQVDPRGNVTSVDILGSQPPKVFDRAARRALLRWQFEPLASGQSASLDVDVKFQRD